MSAATRHAAIDRWITSDGEIVAEQPIERLAATVAVVEYPGGRFDVIRAFDFLIGRVEVSVDVHEGTAQTAFARILEVLS